MNAGVIAPGMSDFLFARGQMGMSLAFHIVFAALGIGMPLLMVVAEGIHLRTGKTVYLQLAKQWAAGTAILFAVGAVSGTVLSFELGLLWPGFMDKAGALIGMPFSLEGFAFFLEGIFLGVYLYGWKRVSPIMHWSSGLLLALGGVFSGIFVVTANAWMNAPAGFRLENGKFTDIDPVAAMLNPASLHEVVHMTLAASMATGFAVAGVHAFFLRRDRTDAFHRAALGIALAVGCICTPLQFLSGDSSARAVAKLQPAKLAAMEALYQTRSGAPLLIGGLPDDEQQMTHYALEIPRGLSLLTARDPNAKVTGLDAFPRGDWPDVRIVHWSFDAMVFCGIAMLVVSVWSGVAWGRQRRVPDGEWLLRALVVVCPLGFVAIEAGWMVTEIGRQPWIIFGVMRTSEAVTPMHHLVVPFITFTGLYVFLAVIVVFLLRRQFLSAHDAAQTSP